METLFRPMDPREQRIFLLCVVVSIGIHVALALLLLPKNASTEQPTATRMAERLAQAVNSATDLETKERAQLEEVLTRVNPGSWDLAEMPDTLQWTTSDLGVLVRDSDVVRALDPERSREGRWDIRIWIDWDEARDASDLLALAFAVGEGTLKSDFGSHRLWVHLQASDGSGRVAFETMDCRLYRAGKLAASDLLHRSIWVEP